VHDLKLILGHDDDDDLSCEKTTIPTVRVLYSIYIAISNQYLRTSLKYTYKQRQACSLCIVRGWYMLAVEFTTFIKEVAVVNRGKLGSPSEKVNRGEVGLSKIRYVDTSRTLQRETQLSRRQVPSISKRLLQPSRSTFSSVDSTCNTIVTTYRMH
jgi:hypothetical protein